MHGSVNRFGCYFRPARSSVHAELCEKSGGRPRRLVILCGHYEGVDERCGSPCTRKKFPSGLCVDRRRVAGAGAHRCRSPFGSRRVGDPESIAEESFTDALLEYPHFTNPAEVRGMPVPEVLLSGHHEAIRLWRRKEACESPI